MTKILKSLPRFASLTAAIAFGVAGAMVMQSAGSFGGAACGFVLLMCGLTWAALSIE